MKRVLLIGSGKRIRNNFLPALSCLSDLFQIVGVYSRSAENRNAVALRWNIPVISDLRDVDLSQVDLVVLSVTLKQHARLIQQLKPYAHRLLLIVDTPVLHMKNLPAIRWLQQFKAVRVAEDYMNFPQFELLRAFLSEGYLGSIRYINLSHNAFEYHALALLRSILNFSTLLSTRRLQTGAKDFIVEYQFAGGCLGVVLEPYRRLSGHFTVTGDKAILTDYTADDHFRVPNLPIYHLEPALTSDGLFQGFQVSLGGKVLKTLYAPFYQQLKTIGFDDHSHFNLLKTSGLIRIFQSVEEENINRHYTFYDGLHDLCCSHLGRRFNSLPMIFPAIKPVLKALAILP